MKRTLYLCLSICLVHLAQAGFAQRATVVQAGSEKLVASPTFACKTAVYDSERRTATFIDQVSFRTDKFDLVSAGKVVYDQKAGKITIYDCKEFTIDGRVVQANKVGKAATVDYRLSSDTAYVR